MKFKYHAIVSTSLYTLLQLTIQETVMSHTHTQQLEPLTVLLLKCLSLLMKTFHKITDVVRDICYTYSGGSWIRLQNYVHVRDGSWKHSRLSDNFFVSPGHRALKEAVPACEAGAFGGDSMSPSASRMALGWESTEVKTIALGSDASGRVESMTRCRMTSK
jgi:hypothetical protein